MVACFHAASAGRGEVSGDVDREAQAPVIRASQHRFGSKSESIEQLQLALESSEIATAAMTARLRLPEEEPPKDKPRRRPIPDHIPRQHIELPEMMPVRIVVASCAAWARM